MASAIGQLLPTAIGVALSPLPIVAVVLMLITPRGRLNGPSFVLGWIVGLGVVGTVVLVLAGSLGSVSKGKPATWESVLDLALGVFLVLVSVREWRRRPRGGEEAATPRWMGAVDTFDPVKAAGLGALLSGANPKNLLLAVAGAAAIARAGIPAGQQIVTYAIFVAIGSVGVGAPVVIALALGARSRSLLDRLKTWMAHNNAVIISVLLLILGAKLVGDAISGLLS